MELKGQRVAVLGAGGSGLAAAALARQLGASVFAFDSGDSEKLTPRVQAFADIDVALTTGDAALTPPEKFDFTVISPGIDASWPIATAFAGASIELIGEIEFAFRHCDTPVIAITGTNGKTTTTELVTAMLEAAGKKAIASGNIGLPYTEVAALSESYDYIVLEVSSFQLETIDTFAPSIAIWMNFAPDHMDRYDTVEDYRDAKLRIFKNRSEGSFNITKHEDDLAGDVTFSAFSEEGTFTYRDGSIVRNDSAAFFGFGRCNLHGKHNAENVMVALAVADRLGISWEDVAPTIESFTAPAHRCEKIATVDGVLYINDSKATNLHALASALAGQEEKVILIVGGKDKGLDFSELNEVVAAKAAHVITLGEIGDEIADLWKGLVPSDRVADVATAVSRASEVAKIQDPKYRITQPTVLFSPGTSSFDQFPSYTARGDAYRVAVQSLSDSNN